MTSVESIGSCSLDFEASDLSEKCNAHYLTASEFTLQSSPCVNGSHKVTEVTKSVEKRFRTELLIENTVEETMHLTNGNGSASKIERSIAEIKLPSYVGISCAINGYTNYSRFCRSRDNSPARAFRKSSYEGHFDYDTQSSILSNHRISDPGVRCSRSQSDCNGNAKSVFTESCEVQVNKEVQIPLKAPHKFTTEHVISQDKEAGKNCAHALSNGRANEEYSLAKEIGITGSKSLVQQRIESLYGVPAQEKAKFPCRTSRLNENINRYVGVTVTVKRSPSCPPQVVKSQLDTNLPVFRHLTKNFRDQLLLDDATHHSGSTLVKAKAVHSLDEEKLDSSSNLHVVNGGHTNGFHSLPSDIGADECDRQAVSPLIQNVILNEFTNSHSKSKKETKDGLYFMRLMDVTAKDIQVDINKWEVELQNPLPEEASGKIRSACGKAKLLLSQKFEQFRGLCVKNLEETEDVPFYTTTSDLEGFWDMVMLQVDDVKTNFNEIEALKQNDWQEVQVAAAAPIPKLRKNLGSVSKSNPCTPKRTVKSAGVAQAREEARKQLLAAKKRGRQQNSTSGDSEVSIFTRDSPS